MAVEASYFQSDHYVNLDLYPGEARERIGDDPPIAGYPAHSPI